MPEARRRLLILSVSALAVCGIFMGRHLTGNLVYVLSYRVQIVATMILVGTASGLATVLFQTVTRNRILTPSVMGFEALFVLIQTGVIFFQGTGGWAEWPTLVRFLTESALMVAFASLLYRWLFSGRQGDLYRLLLAGLVFGILFRSLSELMQRMLAPNEFNVLQGRLFAQLTLPEGDLIAAAAVMIGVSALLAWRRRRELDVIALGRDVAVALGIDYDSAVTRCLVLIAVLVSASTALIGPLTFLGFMTATLAYQLAGSARHAVILPFSALLGVVFLAGGQLVLDHVFGMAGTLSVVIEFVGGGLFLLLLLRKGRL